MFRFTIRDVLWLMVVVGLGVGWWIQNTKQRQALLSAQAKADDLGWKIDFCEELLADFGIKLRHEDNRVEATGDFPDGDAAKGMSRWTQDLKE